MIHETDLLPYSISPLPNGPYLVFAPHPDDETLGMGGTIILATKSGIDVYIIFLTDGEKGGDPDVRREEAKAASEILGIKEIFYLNLPDREVVFTPFPDEILIEILKKVKPAAIFLPSFQEIHPDHRATTNKALFFLENYYKNSCKPNNQTIDHDALNNVKQINFEMWFYEINRQGEINRLIDISDVLDVKESAIECYKSQLEQLDYKLHSLCLNCMRSITLGGQTNYAEGFWCHDIRDADNIYPEQHYFNRLCNYIHQIQHSQQISETDNQSKIFDELRHLRDRINNQANELLNYCNLVKTLGEYINDKTNEIKLLRRDNDNCIKIIHEFEKRVSDIALSRSHRLASAYIKAMMELRQFLKNFKNNRLNLINKSKIKDYSLRLNCCEETTEHNKEYKNELCISNSNLTPLLIEDREEPVLRFFSKNEVHCNIQEHNIYIENITYGKNKVQQLFNNKSVGFSVICPKNNLSRIDLFMVTYKRVNPGILKLSIYDGISIKDNSVNIKEPIRVSRLVSPAILDNRFIAFEFEPISGSEGKHFYITLSLVDGIDDMFPGICINTSKKMNYIEKYHQWIERYEKPNIIKNEHLYNTTLRNDNLHEQPEIAVIIPLLNSNLALDIQSDYNLRMFGETVNSVLNQSYKNWQMLLIINSELENKLNISNGLEIALKNFIYDPRVNIIHYIDYTYDNNSYSCINKAIELLKSKYFITIHPFDILATNALHECVKIINQFPDTDIIYSDEDKISDNINGDSCSRNSWVSEGLRFQPFFKPDWSPDLLLSFMYIGNLTFYRKDVFQKVGGYSSEFKNCYEYDILLKLTELSKNIRHIPKILYHRREVCSRDIYSENSTNLSNSGKIEASNLYKQHLSIKAIKNAINRRCLDADVYEGQTYNSFRVSYKYDHSNLVSIIIPFKDNYDILNTCIQSILRKTKYKNYEIICVNNQSKNLEKFLGLKMLSPNIAIINYDNPFNFSAINNFAVKHAANGDILLFLNSDTEVISGEWLEAMLEHVCRDNVGAVGAKLYYVNDTIQHAGIVVGIAGLAGHAFKHVSRYKTNFYYGFPCMVRNVSAVTGACMMTKRSVFEEVGGFDEEHFKISYNDLDLCLKMREKGYQIIYTPFAELYHYESYSRGYSFDPVATENIKAKWGKTLELDPFYNKNLTIYKEDWSLE